jgi:carnitine O-acetyltransferase
MHTALVTELQTIANVDLEISPSPYGKGYIKSVKISPDGYLQLALQLAFYRDQGYTPLTYESASTRRFYMGRTEVIRAASEDSKRFVELFEEENG